MKKKLVLPLSFAFILCLVGVLFAQTDRRNSGGAKVTLYAGDGKVIREWNVAGQVEVRDGVFTFIDSKTDHRIRIMGTLVVDAAP